MDARVKVVDICAEKFAWWKSISREHELAPETDRQEQRDSLNGLVDEVDIPSEKVQTKVLDGRPIDVLVNESAAGQHDLILKDADCEAESLFFGSLDLRLLRLSPSAVWIADTDAPTKTRRILAAVDPHVRGEQMLMNERIIRLASVMARQDSAELCVVSAWYTPAASFEHESDDFKRYREAKAHVRRRVWENVEHAVNASLLRIPSDRVLFEEGLPSDMIAAVVLEVQRDLLVMGSVARRGVPGLWIGNTAEEVTRQVECSRTGEVTEDSHHTSIADRRLISDFRSVDRDDLGCDTRWSLKDECGIAVWATDFAIKPSQITPQKVTVWTFCR